MFATGGKSADERLVWSVTGLYSQNSGGLSLHTYTWNLHSATDCVLNFEKNATARAAGQKCNVQLLLLLRRRDTSETPRQMPTIQSTGSMSASVEAASTSAAARSGRRLALGLGGPSPSARAWCVERLRMHSFGRSSERHDRSSRVRSATLEPIAPAPREAQGRRAAAPPSEHSSQAARACSSALRLSVPFHLFLIALSVRPGISFEISVQRLPSALCL